MGPLRFSGTPQTRVFQLTALVALPLTLLLPLVLPAFAATELLVWATFGLAFNLLLGYTGLLSFGHALYFGFGGYTLTLLLIHLKIPVLLGLLAGMAVGGATALIVGLVGIHRIGVYFAMLTLAAGQVGFFVTMTWTSFTGGDNGLSVPRPPIVIPAVGRIDINPPLNYYYFVLTCFLITFFFFRRIADSPFGRVLQGIRENELRARCLGVDVERFKLLAFVLSGTFAGLAGGLHAMLVKFMHPDSVKWTTSGDVVVITVIGGARSIFGPLFGSGVFITLSDYIPKICSEWSGSQLCDRWWLILGAIFILFMLFLREGVWGRIEMALEARTRRALARRKARAQELSVAPLTGAADRGSPPGRG
jgi:branched-chain amino acid transport system permease protein